MICVIQILRVISDIGKLIQIDLVVGDMKESYENKLIAFYGIKSKFF